MQLCMAGRAACVHRKIACVLKRSKEIEMRSKILTVSALSVLCFLTACKKEPNPTPAPASPQVEQPAPAQPETAAPSKQTAQPQSVSPSSGESLIREPAAAPSSNQEAVQAIQTKTMGNNNTIHLVKAKVVGAILHVEFIAVPPKKGDGSYESIPGSWHKLADFDYIDEATSKKVGLLQDESGKYMADPVGADGKEIRIPGYSRQPHTISLKFPAPPETSPTITIDFPGVGSFDSVPVSR